MQPRKRKRSLKRLAIIGGILVLLGLSILIILANYYVEPVLRKRLHTLIIDGSDSLYTYKLGSLNVHLFGGNIEVKNLQVNVDSNRYSFLQSRNALPAMVMQLDVQKASIKGIGIFSLLFNKKILIEEISSKDADVRLLRNFKNEDTSTKVTENKLPLWKTLQPSIKDIAVDRIKLDGIKLLYKNTEGPDAAKLQFDRCDAEFDNIRIDSASIADTARIGYVKNFSLKFHDLKFRTSDSTYKLKAEWITYDSEDRLLQIDSFKLQPTLKEDERIDSLRKSWYTVTFDKVNFMGLRLDRYLRFNRAEADSVVFQNPKLAIYQDKQALKNYRSKIGHYPHQELLNANAIIDIKKFIAVNMQIDVTEKQEETRQEGTIELRDLNVSVQNIINDQALIRQNPVMTATAAGKIIGSPIQADFRFYLDSAEGKFDIKGNLSNVTARQIKPLSLTLANIDVPSANIETLNFFVRGEDYGAVADVDMRYSNLSIVFLKRDKETGDLSTRSFLTKLLNNYAIYTSNPIGGAERRAQNIKTARLTTQSFFGVIWQAVFAGMQSIILKTS
ncbi:MAG: hypothetical protein EOO10_07045 [Chitinophagaceae bacterium]|nr:MAG: hypothetical protein EOO10_07045 [Chitinophagaceae bacterium]